jgi:hypothetical protein
MIMDNKVIYTVTANDILSCKLREMTKNARVRGHNGGSLAVLKIGMAFGAYQVANLSDLSSKWETYCGGCKMDSQRFRQLQQRQTEWYKNTMAVCISQRIWAFEGLLSANKV